MASAPVIDCNPPYLFPEYPVSAVRAPSKQLVQLPRHWFHEMPGPVFGRIAVNEHDNDLTQGTGGRPAGQLITFEGQVLDSDGRAVPNTLIEIWQANASGRYVDKMDPQFMPLDPYFHGAGRTITDSEGRYHFRTVRPAAYPGAPNQPFRPAHIHVSLFGPGLADRLITQMYFEDDPLIKGDAVVRSIPDPRGVERLTARMNIPKIEMFGVDAALAYDWDIVLRGPSATPLERVES